MDHSSVDTFTTSTDLPYAKNQQLNATIILFFVLSCFDSVGLLIAPRTFLIFECFAFFICIMTHFVTQKNLHDYRLYFENDYLLIKDRTTGETFEVYDILASDFIIKQTKKDKKRNYCGVATKRTVFMFAGVKNCNELKEYISNHYE